MKYPVTLRKTEEGYSVSCTGLPGCWSQGATEEEALANAGEAIRAVLAYRQEQGMAPPSDAHPEIRQVTVAA